MKVSDIIKKADKTLFSFEVLPPLKGSGIDSIYKIVDPLMEFNPQFINITSHREQFDDTHKKVRRRPGTVAIAAALMHKYNVTVIPHILCGGFTRSETEYVLIDLNFLGITNVLALRGDTLKNEEFYSPEADGNMHAEDLINQIQDMNRGKYIDDTDFGQSVCTNFACGVAGYPEKHCDAISFGSDLQYLKQKVDAGADYIVTQMFFDNSKYYEFVEKCRNIGITVPIIPGIKPLGVKNQVNVLPNLFHIDIPADLKKAIDQCADDDAAKQVGTEWAVMQARDLIKNNAPIIHLYTYGLAKQAYNVASAIF